MAYFAHSGQRDDRSDWQKLDVHALAAARLAAEFARPFGLERAAFLAGLLHDIGKYTAAFQGRLRGDGTAVDHSTAGAAHVLDLVEQTPHAALMAQLIAYGILGHHAGLPDRLGTTGFDDRIERFRADPKRGLDPIWREDLKPDATALFPVNFRADQGRVAFQFAVMARMLFSCLVDADFKDTEAFYCELEGREQDRDWATLPDLLPDLLARFDRHMAHLGRGTTSINAVRSEILEHVRAKALEAPGLFTLTVPTGGGSGFTSVVIRSRPSRARGSKPELWTTSLPRSRRALRGRVDRNAQYERLHFGRHQVAPFAGAWIETR